MDFQVDLSRSEFASNFVDKILSKDGKWLMDPVRSKPKPLHILTQSHSQQNQAVQNRKGHRLRPPLRHNATP